MNFIEIHFGLLPGWIGHSVSDQSALPVYSHPQVGIATISMVQAKQIFASRYKLNIPSEAKLTAEIKRELKELKRQ